MFLRTYIKAKTREEAQNHLNNLLTMAEALNIKLTILNVEPFWKFKNSFKIEIRGIELTDEILSEFLGSIASKWDRFPDSFLASETLEGCTIFLDNIEFIEVFNKEF
ncbi:hypothetical protein [Cytobacillus pseudoceanisediminis]|uniref:hypothetical protein n=1 Tax=Cytobacillus pseudoceanisediminis TaxID=3051614 RepID=UPI003C2AB5AD